MSIWNQAYEDFRAPYYEEEKKAKKDYDGDGKVETGSQEYLGSRDKAIKKAMGKCKDCGKDPCGCDTKKEEVESVDEALTGERYKKVMKKPGGTAYSRKVSADPSKRAARGGRGGESDFGAGDRGAGNKAARRAGTYQEEYVDEATAMAKRGYDEAPIRQKIAKSTGGGKSADRATALEKKPTFGDDKAAKQRSDYARKQRGDFRKTTSSDSGLRGYGHKSNDPKVKVKQAARGAQRGALTPAEKKQLNREEFELWVNELVEEGYDLSDYTWDEMYDIYEGYKEIDREKESKMYRRAGNLARTALSSRGKKKEDAMNKSGKIVSAITRQKENERFSKMADEKARSNYKEESEIEEGLKQARKNIGMDPNKPSCWDGYKAQGTKKKGGKEVPNCVKEGDAADEKSMKVFQQLQRNVDEKRKKKMKKEHADWRAEMGFIDEASCDSDKPKEKWGVKNKVRVMPEVKTENVQGGPLLPGEGRKVYPKGSVPKKTGATLPLANSYELEGEMFDENRRAARSAGGYKDDSKKQPDPSKDGFTGIGNMSIDQIRKMSARIDKEKKSKKEEFELDESDSLAAMQARREKRLARQRKQMGTSATGQDFGHDYGISSAERKKRQQAEFDAFVGRGKKTKKEEVEFAGNYEGPLYARHPDLAQNDEVELDEKFKTQYGDKTKLSQSSKRKSLGRGSSIKDGAKKSGYESPKEFRDSEKKLAPYKESLLDKVLKTYVSEEDYDRMKDRRMERGGVGGNQRYDRAPKAPNTKKFGSGKTALQKQMEKKYGKGKSAMDIVRAEIEAKYGKGAIMDTKKKSDN